MPVSALILASVLAPIQTWTPPYDVVKLPKTPQEFTTELPEEGDGRVWLEDDVLKIVYRADKAEFVNISGGLSSPLTRFAGTGYWGAQFRYRNWGSAIVTYTFIPQPRRADFAFTFKDWRGENAPASPESAVKLKGKMTDKEFATPWLSNKRIVHVYMPPSADTNVPFIVMADGQGTESFAKILEPLILAGKVRPLALVGIESGPYFGEAKEYQPEKDYRANEYLRRQNPEVFDAHLRWIISDVMPWARAEFKLSDVRDDTGIFGFSNGGSFAAQAAVRYPDKFGVAFPFSAGFPPEESHVTGKLPKFYFAAGELESFSARTKQAYNLVKKWYAEAEYDEYIAGHDSKMWEIAFVAAVQKAFPPPELLNQSR